MALVVASAAAACGSGADSPSAQPPLVRVAEVAGPGAMVEDRDALQDHLGEIVKLRGQVAVVSGSSSFRVLGRTGATIAVRGPHGGVVEGTDVEVIGRLHMYDAGPSVQPALAIEASSDVVRVV